PPPHRRDRPGIWESPRVDAIAPEGAGEVVERGTVRRCRGPLAGLSLAKRNLLRRSVRQKYISRRSHPVRGNHQRRGVITATARAPNRGAAGPSATRVRRGRAPAPPPPAPASRAACTRSARS